MTKKPSVKDLANALHHELSHTDFIRRKMFESTIGKLRLFPVLPTKHPSYVPHATMTGRFPSKGPNLANGPKCVPSKNISMKVVGSFPATKVKVNRSALKSALYGSMYGRRGLLDDMKDLDVVLLPPKGTSPGYQEVCLECHLQLRCAMGPPHLPVVCEHCRSPGLFWQKIHPYLTAPLGKFALEELKVSWSERAELENDLCDDNDVVPTACPMFQHAFYRCTRCQCDRRRARNVTAIRSTDLKGDTIYLYGGPDRPTHTFKEWAGRCAGKRRGSLHDRQRQRYARQTERKKLGKDAKQQQAGRRLQSRTRKRKKAKR
jgi:hypothetical protein